MEQIYQWFENRKKTFWSFSFYLMMTDWKEQEPETELFIKHLKLSIAHYFKACCNLFLIWAKTSSFNISHLAQGVLPY